MKIEFKSASSGGSVRSIGAIAIAAGFVFTTGHAAPRGCAEYTMAIAHLLPEDMNNEVQPHHSLQVSCQSGTNGAVEVQILAAAARIRGRNWQAGSGWQAPAVDRHFVDVLIL